MTTDLNRVCTLHHCSKNVFTDKHFLADLSCNFLTFAADLNCPNLRTKDLLFMKQCPAFEQWYLTNCLYKNCYEALLTLIN